MSTLRETLPTGPVVPPVAAAALVARHRARRVRRVRGARGCAGRDRRQRRDVERHVRCRTAPRCADRPGGTRRPVLGARGHRQHRSRGDDDPRHLVRRVGRLAMGTLGRRAVRCDRGRARRAAARGRDGDVRRRPRRVGCRDQHHRVGSDALPRHRGLHRATGRVGEPLAAGQRQRRALHVPVPRRRQPLRLADARPVRMAREEALVLRVRPRGPREGHDRELVVAHDHRDRARAFQRLRALAHRRSVCGCGRWARRPPPPTRSACRCTA